jgi:chemotaxis signal transduction protein
MEMENSVLPHESASEFAGTPSCPTEPQLGDTVAAPDEVYSEAGTHSVERLAIQLGSLHLLCAPDIGREVILPPPVSQLPHTPTWLVGVANVRGTMLPVLDLALACGIEHQERLRRYVLVIGDSADQIGLLVDGLPVLRRFETAERLNNVPPQPPMLDGHVHDAYAQGGKEWIDVNIKGLLDRIGELIATPSH